MAFNHKKMKIIRHSIANQLNAIGTPPGPIPLTCTGCHMGKLNRHHQKRVKNTYDVCEVICSDVCGPMKTGQRGVRYMIKFTDIESRYTFILPMHSRVQVVECMEKAIQYVKYQTGHSSRIMYSDNAAEYIGVVVMEILTNSGSTSCTTVP